MTGKCVKTREIELVWYDLGSVRILYEMLKPDDYFRKLTFDQLEKTGLYMFVDKTGKARYIGQAFNCKQYPLAHRIRWEIVKDGNGCTESAFFRKCKKYDVNRFDLCLKAAHIKKATENGIKIEENSPSMRYFLNAVERALIFKMSTMGHPLMNETGINSYKRGSIKILNSGEHVPLPQQFDLL